MCCLMEIVDMKETGAGFSATQVHLLKEAQILEMLSTSHATWWRWVKANPELLAPIRLGRNTTRWRASAVLAFVEHAEQCGAKSHTSKGGAGV